MMRHSRLLVAAATTTATTVPSSLSDLAATASSLTRAVEALSPMPVYLKPSSSPHRKPSFYFPRMREEQRASYAFHPGSLGAALPLFSITSSSCEYYALRLPLLKAGFHRLPSEARDVASNLVWGRSMPFREMLACSGAAPTLGFAATSTPEQAAYVDRLRMVNDHQRFNHFPLSHSNLGCKRGMAVNVRRAVDTAVRAASSAQERDAVQARYRFVPRTWFYPLERESLIREMRSASADRHFIWKPARGSCGRGILISQGGHENEASWRRVMTEIEHKASSRETRRLFGNYVVQEYIDNPFLVEGRKMDLRLYVGVTSFNPLTVYWHEEGLVRFAAEPYADDSATLPAGGGGAGQRHDAADAHSRHMHERFRHLTNYSVGRRYAAVQQQEQLQQHARTGTAVPAATPVEGDNPLADASATTPELKWPLQRLWDYLDAHAPASATGLVSGRASDRVREEVAQLITRTLMAVRPAIDDGVRRVPMPGGYFELYGFDVMLDAQLRPYLIEVNTLPSLESSSSFDYATKTNVVSDLLNMAMLEPFERPVVPGGTLWGSEQLRESLRCPLEPQQQTLVHRAIADTESTGSRGASHDTREEVELRLKDELAYARGFHRIFPAKPPAAPIPSPVAPLHQPLDALASSPLYLADTRAYAAAGLLSEQDGWALGA